MITTSLPLPPPPSAVVAEMLLYQIRICVNDDNWYGCSRECLVLRHEVQALLIRQAMIMLCLIMLCWYVVNMMLCITSNHQAY